MRSRIAIAALAGVVSAAVIAGFASAQTSSTEKIRACRLNAATATRPKGDLRHIPAYTNCASTETKIVWNVEGPPGDDAVAPRIDFIQLAPAAAPACTGPTVGAEWVSLGICSDVNSTVPFLREIDASRYPAGATFRLEVGIIAGPTGVGSCARLADIDTGTPPGFAPVDGSTVCGASSPGQDRLRSDSFELPAVAHHYYVEMQTGDGYTLYDPVLIATW
jgi:hypothetical protein